MTGTVHADTQKPASSPDTEGAAESSPVRTLLALGSKFYLYVILIVLCLVIGASEPGFWGMGNLRNVLFQAAFTGIAACGLTVLIAGGLIDLSVGGVIAVSSIAVAKILPQTTIGGAFAVALVIGIILGVINGLVVAYAKIPAFIATLGTLNLFLGLAFIVTSGRVVPIQSSNFRAATTDTIAGIPTPFVVFLLLAALTALLLRRTHFGRSIRAVGSNERSSVLAGIQVKRTKVLAFAFAGACAALAGIYLAGRLSSAEGNMSIGFEMDVIAAVVVGGTALRGGNATVGGTIAGALLFAVLANALNLLGVASYWQYVVTGVVLVAAIAIGNRNASDLSVRGED